MGPNKRQNISYKIIFLCQLVNHKNAKQAELQQKLKHKLMTPVSQYGKNVEVTKRLSHKFMKLRSMILCRPQYGELGHAILELGWGCSDVSEDTIH